jgi:hypothetical protein
MQVGRNEAMWNDKGEGTGRMMSWPADDAEMGTRIPIGGAQATGSPFLLSSDARGLQ